ncbi:hypothetical protein [Prevotella sp. P6B4]|uniref:hypothetical protein n=1 Tax=Prevotella sp. P6B4 TaxID=1410614 RepID=UPI00048D84AB|nr:hypothetical protein [Prevotella sp. P6B4]
MMIRRMLFFIYLCFSLKTNAQVQQDTIQISEYCIILSFPGEYIIKEYSYEEGVFYDYFFLQESSIITIHVGSMVILPLIEKKDIISSCLIGNILKDETAKYLEDGKLKYCREINIFPYHLNIIYDKVSSQLKDKYDFVFDNIKVFR